MAEKQLTSRFRDSTRPRTRSLLAEVVVTPSGNDRSGMRCSDHDHQDGTLAFRFCCRAGSVVRVPWSSPAGEAGLRDPKGQFKQESEILISPLPHQKVVKDLAVDYTLFFDRAESR